MLYPQGFDLARAQELCKLIDNAYTQYNQRSLPPNQQSWQPIGYAVTTEFQAMEGNNNVPFGFVATKATDAYVVIRGTLTPLEWFDDASIKPVNFLNGAWGKTTFGFNTIYQQLSPAIIGALKNVTPTPTNVFVTGHSLGAALANLSTPDILTKINFRPILYTFAGPRTGDIEFATKYQDSGLASWRIFNTEDIVPTLPLSTIDFNASDLGLYNSPIELLLISFLKHTTGGLNFEHIETPIAITFQKGNIPDNHNLDNYLSNL